MYPVSKAENLVKNLLVEYQDYSRIKYKFALWEHTLSPERKEFSEKLSKFMTSSHQEIKIG